jgi:hypothetical protein
MKKVLKLAGEGTGDGTISDSSTPLLVQRYWRKLGYPEMLRPHQRSRKSVSTFKLQRTDSRTDKKLRQPKHSVTEMD